MLYTTKRIYCTKMYLPIKYLHEIRNNLFYLKEKLSSSAIWLMYNCIIMNKVTNPKICYVINVASVTLYVHF